jgi:hypothetical protein
MKVVQFGNAVVVVHGTIRYHFSYMRLVGYNNLTTGVRGRVKAENKEMEYHFSDMVIEHYPIVTQDELDEMAK